MPPLTVSDFQALKDRVQVALTAVRQGYDYTDVDQFDDDEREQASLLVQELMDVIDDVLVTYNASEFADDLAEFEANALLDLIKYCRYYVEEHPDITTVYEGEVEESPIQRVQNSEVGSVPSAQGDGERETGPAVGLNATCREEDGIGLQYDDEFDGTMPDYDPLWKFHGEKSLPLPPHLPTRPPRSRDGSRLGESTAGGGVSAEEIMSHSPPPQSQDPLLPVKINNPPITGPTPPPPSPAQFTLPFSTVVDGQGGGSDGQRGLSGSANANGGGLDGVQVYAESVAPSLTGTLSDHSSVYSDRSIQLQKHAAEDIAKEERRLEENRQYVLAHKAGLLRQLNECDVQFKLDEELARQKKSAIETNLHEGMKYLAEQEGLAARSEMERQLPPQPVLPQPVFPLPGVTQSGPVSSGGVVSAGAAGKVKTGLGSVEQITPNDSLAKDFLVPSGGASTAKKSGRMVNFHPAVELKTSTVPCEKRIGRDRKLVKSEVDRQEAEWKVALDERDKEIKRLEEEHARQTKELTEAVAEQRAKVLASKEDVARLNVANEIQKHELLMHKEGSYSVDRKAAAVPSGLDPAAPSFTPTPFSLPLHSSDPPPPPPSSKGLDDLTRVQIQILALGQLKEARPKVKWWSTP